ncbi:substrate-binding domain-containing protein [Actinomadura fibrosa]|uniref:Substrate-binding domain-containing protein n=1 Tax=Actinomadura fibrosa TaxID=111802 RepID=A0ABW2XY69_9ACTN|nr:substrate-binding domain-containing protein [Actinomadura fibrosa]
MRRRVLLGPLAAAVGLTVVGGLGAYALAGTGGGCSGDGTLTLAVAAAPDVAPAVARAVGRFNDDGNEVGGKCVRARVSATDPVAVATLLSGRGSAGVTQKPDVWIPDSTLWTKLVQGTAGNQAGNLTDLGSMAGTPIVVAMPKTLAGQLREKGVPAQPSWEDLLRAAGTAENSTKDPADGEGRGGIPRRLFRLQVPDPNRTATGMGALTLAGTLLSRVQGGEALFTGAVRTFREGIAASVDAEFTAFRKERGERYPVALAPEQAVFGYNARRPAEPAVAVHPAEGTVLLDYPVVNLSRDSAKGRASGLLMKALTSAATRDDLRRLGFRTSDGTAPPQFSASNGLDPRGLHALSTPPPAEVRRTMQSWARLSLSIRMLSIIDVSGSMDEEVAPGVTRLQSTISTAQGGLSLLPDDTELGQWVFSTRLQGDQDWREMVSVGPLGERLGSSTRRQLVLSAFAQMRAKEHGDTGLYDTVMAAFDYMKRTYKPEFVNSILLWTDGRNEDPGGPSLRATLDVLRREYDPERPVPVFMFGYGRDVDVAELREIARATRGEVFVADTPGQVQEIFLKAISRRVCAPNC